MGVMLFLLVVRWLICFKIKQKRESTGDYDVFFIDRFRGYSVTEFKLIKELGYLTEYEIDNHKFQFISKTYGEPEEVIENFDIRACSICTNGEYVWWSKGSLKDIRDKKIVCLNPHNSLTNYLRIQKYIQKGFTISFPDYLILSLMNIERIFELDGVYNTERYRGMMLDRNYVHSREGFEYDGFFDNPCKSEIMPNFVEGREIFRINNEGIIIPTPTELTPTAAIDEW